MKAYSRILAILLILILGASTAHAVALGVNKAKMRFNNVLKGGYAQNTLTVSTDASQNITLDTYKRGEIANWIRVVSADDNQTNLTFSGDNPKKLRIIVEPPEDVANGVYTGELRLLTGEFIKAQGQYGSALRASFTVDISIGITGDQIQKCTAGGFSITHTEKGFPLELHASLQNNGNVRVSPEFEVDIWNQQQTEIVQSATVSTQEEVLPTTSDNFLLRFNNSLPIGQYFAKITETTCQDSRMVTFSVVELGGISDKGELLRIDNEPWAQTEDIIRIAAIFKNIGKRVVSAKFKGTINKDGKTVEVIDTDPLNVRPGQTQQLESFFNPTEPGRYQVKGRVIYNGKLTFEKSSHINVRGEVGPRVTGNVVDRILKNPYQVSMILIVLVIAGLLYLIRRERKKRRV